MPSKIPFSLKWRIDKHARHRAERDGSFDNPYIVIGKQRLSRYSFCDFSLSLSHNVRGCIDGIDFCSRFSLCVFAN